MLTLKDLYDELSSIEPIKSIVAPDETCVQSGASCLRFNVYGGSVSSDELLVGETDDERLAHAAEESARLCNSTIVDVGDRYSVRLDTASAADTYWHQLISPSYLPGAEGFEDFARLKYEAKERWQSSERASVSVPGMTFRAGLVAPRNWYDVTSSSNWVHHDLVVASSQSISGNDDGSMRAARNRETGFRDATVRAKAPALEYWDEHVGQTTDAEIRSLSEFRAADARFRGKWGSLVKSMSAQQARAAVKSGSHPVSARKLSLGFYLLVANLNRPWLFEPVLQNDAWAVGGMERGELANATVAPNFAWMATHMLVIHGLEAELEERSKKREVPESVSGLGPFRVARSAQSQRLSYDGAQIIGWVMRRFPSLPPRTGDANDAKETQR